MNPALYQGTGFSRAVEKQENGGLEPLKKLRRQ
jgi:hypothetical protein